MDKEEIINNFIEKFLYDYNKNCENESDKYSVVYKNIEFNSCGSIDLELFLKSQANIITIKRFYTVDISKILSEEYSMFFNKLDAKLLLSLFE